MKRPVSKDFGDDFSELQSYCEQYLDEIENGEYEDSDAEHYIFEAAMELFYGENVWDYVNDPNSKT